MKLIKLFILLTFLVLNVGIAGAQQNYQYVDLGLPSGTLWATCNVGASNPWEYGDFFAWGETKPKQNYNWSTYKYANGDYYKQTKYCTTNSNGDNGFTDNLTVLEPSDDVANVIWGKDWCMPTITQWQELKNNCSNTWTNNYEGKGIAGRIFTSNKNGNTIFLPAAGGWDENDGLVMLGIAGSYWSSSLRLDGQGDALRFVFTSEGTYRGSYGYRCLGMSVRAVRK